MLFLYWTNPICAVQYHGNIQSDTPVEEKAYIKSKLAKVMAALDRIDPPHQPTKNANQQGIDASGGKPEISSLGNSEQNMDIANDETLITPQHEGDPAVPNCSVGELHRSTVKDLDIANEETLQNMDIETHNNAKNE